MIDDTIVTLEAMVKRAFVVLFVISVVASCAADQANGPDHDVEVVSAERIEYFGGVEKPRPLECSSDVLYVRCPYLYFTARVTVDVIPDGRTALVWWAPVGIEDRGASQMLATAGERGCLLNDGGTDNTGLLHPFSLCPDRRGDLVGELRWTLRAEAGDARITFRIDMH